MLGKNISTGRKTNSTKEGNNGFPATGGEIVFTLVFQDDDKIRI